MRRNEKPMLLPVYTSLPWPSRLPHLCPVEICNAYPIFRSETLKNLVCRSSSKRNHERGYNYFAEKYIFNVWGLIRFKKKKKVQLHRIPKTMVVKQLLDATDHTRKLEFHSHLKFQSVPQKQSLMDAAHVLMARVGTVDILWACCTSLLILR